MIKCQALSTFSACTNSYERCQYVPIDFPLYIHMNDPCTSIRMPAACSFNPQCSTSIENAFDPTWPSVGTRGGQVHVHGCRCHHSWVKCFVRGIMIRTLSFVGVVVHFVGIVVHFVGVVVHFMGIVVCFMGIIGS